MKKFRTLFEKSDPCWKEYEMIGMKDKNGKKVPNCVPVKEDNLDEVSLGNYKEKATQQVKELKPHAKGEYGGIVKRAIERRSKGLKMAMKREEVEQIDELKDATLRDYKRKAETSQDFAKQRLSAANSANDSKAANAAAKDVVNRRYGLKAVKKRLGENMQMDESDVSNPHQAAITHHHTELMKTFKSGDTAARAHHEKELDSAKERFRAHRAANTPAPAPAKPGSIGHYYANATRTNDSVEVDGDVLSEGRPSQRHPLEGHEYHKKSDEALVHIAKDAHAAAEAMKSHNTDAENKYRDQANDSATVRHYRKTHGMQPWYKKKYGHVNEELSEGVNSPGVGWMLKADPKLGAKVDANKKKFKSFKQNVGKQANGAEYAAQRRKERLASNGRMDEDNVINTNSDNSIDGVKPATQDSTKKNKQVIDRYATGPSSGVSGTTVVASPRNESVEQPPFDKPYKKVAKNVKDKSGAVHTPMSRVRDLARKAARKNGGLKEDNESTLSSYDRDDTPAKKTLSKTAGMVRDLVGKAKEKAKGKKSDDKFQPEPELASNIVR